MNVNASAKQINFIKLLIEDLGEDEDKYNLIGISKAEASEIINDLLVKKID